MKRVLCGIAAFLCLTAGFMSGQNYLCHSVEVNLTVRRPADVQKMIISWIEQKNGAFIEWSGRRLVLRIQQETLEDFKKMLYAINGDIGEYSQSAEDARERMSELKSEIINHEEIFRKNLQILGVTDVVNTLDIEKEMISLITEIEQRKGKLRMLEYKTRVAFVTILFHFKTTTRPEKQNSPFPAIQNLDMYDFLKRMESSYENRE